MDSVKNFIKIGKRDIFRALVYWGIFSIVIIFFEVALRIMMSGKINLANISFLAFVPAQAMFFTIFAGIAKKRSNINRLVLILIMLIITFFYGIQMIYYQIFGSVLSVSLLGMGGDAVGNFSWAIRSIFLAVWPYLLLFLVPIILVGVTSFNKKINNFTRKMPGRGYAPILHIVCLVLTVGLWFGGVMLLKAQGTGRQSAYYVMNDAYADSDTTAEKVGVLSTTLLEAASRYLGISGKNNEQTVVVVDTGALSLGKGDSSVGLGSQDAGSGQGADVSETVNVTASGSENTEEQEIPENSFVAEPHINKAIDFDALAALTSDEEIKSLCSYFASKEATRTNEYTGMFEGYNLIYICAESFSSYAVDPDVTPMLYKMANNGIVLTNYYNSFKNTTSNGEYAFAGGYWPDVSRVADDGAVIGSFPQSARTLMPYGLGDFFNSINVNTYGFHDFIGAYYKRNYTWPNLGYENLKFLGQGMYFTTSWPAPDLEMFQQSVDDYINDEQFHAYYMTFSGHGPYTRDNVMYWRNINSVKELTGDKYTSTEALSYLCGEYELERGIEYLVQRLEEAGKLDKTVIVIAGDHYPYYLTNNGLNAFPNDIEDFTDFEMYHSTCIIYNSGIEEPIVNDEYCCNVDILPTVLNLFGFEYDSRLLSGIDVFSDGMHRARLYNGNFLTEYVRYNNSTGELIWQEDALQYSEEQLEAYFNAMLDYTTSEYTASLMLQNKNFIFYVWMNSGFMTDEEIEAEKTRQSKVEAAYRYEYVTIPTPDTTVQSVEDIVVNPEEAAEGTDVSDEVTP